MSQNGEFQEKVHYAVVDGQNGDLIRLCGELDQFLNDLVGGEENRAEYIPYNLLCDIHDAVLAYAGKKPVGCASFKRYDRTTAEVKRVFVREDYRGRGIAGELMSRLEAMAGGAGFKRLILETGEPLAGAMRLYKGMGYRVIPNYGQYAEMEDSVCMEKIIGQGR